MVMKGLGARLERLERRQAVAGTAARSGAVVVELTPEHQAEVLHILCACGVFALSIDPHDPDGHPLQATGRALLQARGVLDDDGYLVPGVTVDALVA
jgi:hypothetical protein